MNKLNLNISTLSKESQKAMNANPNNVKLDLSPLDGKFTNLQSIYISPRDFEIFESSDKFLSDISKIIS